MTVENRKLWRTNHTCNSGQTENGEREPSPLCLLPGFDILHYGLGCALECAFLLLFVLIAVAAIGDGYNIINYAQED